MQIMNLFPTPVGIDTYPDTHLLKEECKEFFKEVTDEKNNDLQKFNIFEREGKIIKKFYDFMKESVNLYAKKIEANSEFDVDSSWIFVDENLNPHHHAIVPIVSVFYLDAENPPMDPEKMSFSSPIGDLIFIDPRAGVNLYRRDNSKIAGNKAKELKRTGINSTFNGSGGYNLKPRTGMIAHFPGYLIHYVNRNISNNPRVVLGANWERMIEIEKLDPNKPRVPKAIAYSEAINPNSSEEYARYLNKKNYNY